jgi:hypothetical protein
MTEEPKVVLAAPPRQNRAVGRESDQGDWNICIAWQRMFVACQSARWPLRIPITLFLYDSKKLVEGCHPRVSNQAHEEIREAWLALGEDNEWMACVLGCKARSVAEQDPTTDRQAVEGRPLCRLIRQSYPKTPPGFEKTGRLAGDRGP